MNELKRKNAEREREKKKNDTGRRVREDEGMRCKEAVLLRQPYQKLHIVINSETLTAVVCMAVQGILGIEAASTRMSKASRLSTQLPGPSPSSLTLGQKG